MKIHDEGFFLYSKNFGEKSKILYISIERLWFDKGSFKVFQKQKH